jgi:hypothetical protein
MDETDTSPGGVEAEAARAAREWAEQRRAAARSQFETPSWIGPSRGPAPSDEPTSLIPEQPEPAHDFVVPQPRAESIPESAHWVERAKPRIIAGVVLVAAIAGLVTSLVLTITTQSPGAIIGLISSAFVAVIFRGALMSSTTTTVDLKGSTLRVRQGGILDEVNLADPIHVVQLVGTPDQPSWRLRLERLDGQTIELGPQQVDPTEMHRIVEYYQAIATRDRRAREERYNR